MKTLEYLEKILSPTLLRVDAVSIEQQNLRSSSSDQDGVTEYFLVKVTRKQPQEDTPAVCNPTGPPEDSCESCQ